MRKWLIPGMVFALLAALVAGSRLLPHPPNFTPLMAVALFSGALFGRSLWAYMIPLAAMVLSDAFLGFHSLSGVVYIGMALAVLFGGIAEDWKPVGEKKVLFGLKWLSLALVADGIFFVLTNFGVWALTPYYEKSVSGLAECYVMALPFLLNQLLGTGTFLGLLLFTWHGLKVLSRWRVPGKVSYQRYKS
ncbi:MAG TPA: hypothetical protein DCL41_00360 [Bdellovibrionales bacterium]|nr:hypothetical protein [Pseudobdellovibrionaceae bacterium]HAG90290.1 hypothetical protein [Bdellovibrionales bacterium]|tara:strand:- start:130 stop:699 length:570 start_codon:yes stop_codon:yes gene_type:complete